MDTIRKVTNHQARYEIHARRDFINSTGTLSGYEIGSDPNNGSYGRLPKEFRESCRWADYRVYSYATPIAWFSAEHGWTMPDVFYSQTTTCRHQSACKTADLAHSDPYWDQFDR